MTSRTNSLLDRSRYLLLTTGILILGYCSFVLLDAKLYQAYQEWRFQQALANVKPSIGSAERLPPVLAEASRTNAEGPGRAGRAGAPLGRIEIERIGVTAMIMEGIDDKTLRRAVGHFPGTALPGQLGNVAIAGHRDTFFRALRHVRKDDEITLTTLTGSHRYRVDSIAVVEPEAVEVLDDSDDAILTLVTCYPFDFVGPAPRRFIVRARSSPASP